MIKVNMYVACISNTDIEENKKTPAMPWKLKAYELKCQVEGKFHKLFIATKHLGHWEFCYDWISALLFANMPQVNY